MKIVNPTNSDHFADIEEVHESFKKEIQGEVICDASEYVLLREMVRDIPHGTCIYVDSKYVKLDLLDKIEKKTHCPLKGDASYYTYQGKEVAWSYEDALPSAAVIKNMISFY